MELFLTVNDIYYEYQDKTSFIEQIICTWRFEQLYFIVCFDFQLNSLEIIGIQCSMFQGLIKFIIKYKGITLRF